MQPVNLINPIKKLVFSVLLIAAVLSGTTAQAQAAAAELPSGVLIGDQNGLTVSADGDYFINADALEAGDVITKTLAIRNLESYSYKIFMRAEPLEETGPLHLLNEVKCTLTLDGKVLYDGRVRGDEGINMILESMDLGTYMSGDQRTLEIKLTVNPEMKKYYWTASEAFFKWHFYAARDEKSDKPNTGEAAKNSLYVIFPGMVLAMGILVLIKRRQQAEEIEMINE